MSKQIVWSPLAVSDVEKTLDYLQKEWNEQVTLAFLDEIDKLLKQISFNPKQFPQVNRKLKVRKCVLTKQNTLFYRENKGFVELLRFFDTRQNPKKLKYK